MGKMMVMIDLEYGKVRKRSTKGGCFGSLQGFDDCESLGYIR